eukprot:GHVN01009952.1.p2 GENE.GHVN01009952.1~~GHVN01009952.1.p2  ORF type:complete len:460 (-),score=58.42 GHVN01009952.1:146-1525(-)
MSAWPGMDVALANALKNCGKDAPTPVQTAVLSMLETHPHANILASSKTGSGKTLAFALPIIKALLRDNTQRALVFAPTRELAIQIERSIREVLVHLPMKNIHATSVVGGIFIEKQLRILKKRPQIVISTPGRLWQLIEENAFVANEMDQFRFLVFDEADRLFEEGHFLSLNKTLPLLTSNIQTFVCSATLHADRFFEAVTAKALSKHFVTVNLSGESEKTDVERHVAYCTDKLPTLISFLQQKRKTLVFANTITTAKRVARSLSLLGFGVICLHAKMEQKIRLKRLDVFRARDGAIAVCTDVAARGIDILSVELVVNFEMPQTEKTYIHRVGRTARAGRSGLSLDLVSCDEEHAHKEMEWNMQLSFKIFSPQRNVVAALARAVLICNEIFDREKKGKETETWLASLEKTIKKNKLRRFLRQKHKARDTPCTQVSSQKEAPKTIEDAIQQLKDDQKRKTK